MLFIQILTRYFITLSLLSLGFSVSAFGASASQMLRSAPALTANDLVVIVNEADPLSVRIADYYGRKRGIPDNQIVRVRFNPSMKVMKTEQFEAIKAEVDAKTPAHVQAFVLTWLQPFRVDCMSITTAFAAGYNQAFCASGCLNTLKSPYFASESAKPYKDHQWRPSIILAGRNFEEAKELIDRGIAADYTHPKGSAYLLQTKDKARSSRAALFPGITESFNGAWPVNFLKRDFIKNKSDVMFYFTGLTHVPHIHDNYYPPGAVADHLTSTGGVLTGSKQMSVIEWIEAGVTGSYGAVVEPCNFPEKFPHPGVLMFYYLRGSTLIEAYWKSVARPGQGIFIGEPLAKPFAYPVKKF